MNNSDETLKQPQDNDTVLKAIADLSKHIAGISDELKNLSNRFDNLENRFDKLENRFDNLEKFITVQFEAIREGIEYNSARDDRLEAKVLRGSFRRFQYASRHQRTHASRSEKSVSLVIKNSFV